MIKQLIIIRKDLNMRKGKMIAQGAHASMKVFFDKMKIVRMKPEDIPEFKCKVCIHHYTCQNVEQPYHHESCSFFDTHLSVRSSFTDRMIEWMEGSFTKIVVGCNSEEELQDLKRQADEAGIVNSIIQDNGATEFNCNHCYINKDCTLKGKMLTSFGKCEKIKVYTALAIGPDKAEKIDKITRELKPL